MITSAAEFRRLRLSDDLAEQRRAATEAAPTEVWLEVIGTYPELREWVAVNKTVPLRVLALLAEDHDPRVRAGVASKRKLSEELFTRLAVDRSDTVRERIACNAKTPQELLRKLRDDPDPIVSDAALRRLSR